MRSGLPERLEYEFEALLCESDDLECAAATSGCDAAAEPCADTTDCVDSALLFGAALPQNKQVDTG